MSASAGYTGKQVKHEINRGNEEHRLLRLAEICSCDVPCHENRRSRSEHRLEIVLDRVKNALESHRLEQQTPHVSVFDRGDECP